MEQKEIQQTAFNQTNININKRLNTTIKQYSKKQINKLFGFEIKN